MGRSECAGVALGCDGCIGGEGGGEARCLGGGGGGKKNVWGGGVGAKWWRRRGLGEVGSRIVRENRRQSSAKAPPKRPQSDAETTPKRRRRSRKPAPKQH